MFYTWSGGVLDIYTAIKTALKVTPYDCFDGFLAPLNGQLGQYNRTKQINFQWDQV